MGIEYNSGSLGVFLDAFSRHGKEFQGAYYANYSGVAATLNVALGRNKGEKFEYVQSFTKMGFSLCYIVPDLPTMPFPALTIPCHNFLILAKTSALVVPSRMDSPFLNGKPFCISASRSDVKKVNQVERREQKKQLAAKKRKEILEAATQQRREAARAADELSKCLNMSPDEFYASWEWKRVRYEALKRYGARCMLCGAKAEDGARICVDHIKPRSKYPLLQLDVNNLQVLCNDCNMGKGAWDETDWR